MPISRSIVLLVYLVLIPACAKRTDRTWVRAWQDTSPLNEARSGAGMAAVGDFLYVAGGVSIESGFLRSVEWTRRGKDGNLAPWRSGPPLGVRRGFLALISTDGYLYAIGGSNDDGGKMTLLSSVERAQIREDGEPGAWVPVSSLTTPRRGPAALVTHGFLYALGGYNGLFLRSWERAQLLANGDLGAWQASSSVLMTTDRYIHGAALQGDVLYLVGGHLEEQGGGKATTEWARVGEHGEIEHWQSASPLIDARFLAAVTATRQNLFVLGGYNGNYLASVERAEIRSDGSLGGWAPGTPLARPKEGCAVVSIGNTIYIAGGSEKGVYLREVQMATANEAGELGHWASR